jgi:type VI secretion system protein ImpL
VNNRALAAHALAAARGFSLDPMHAGTPSLDSLQRLDNLRGSLETIVAYRSAGAPLRYRWGLYAGNALYPELRRIYFDRFKTLLFAGTQARLVETLRSVPSKAGSDYGLIYDTLKAYLITTSNHEHSTQSFPAPLLLERWSNGRNVDAAKAALAARQFQFYTSQLKQENPFSNDNDAVAVARAREYLADFGGSERIYRAILSEASARYPAIDFNRQFPGSRAVMIETYQVSGAFSQAGWHFINDAIRNPAQYLSGEQWVLGNAVNANFNMVQIQNELHARYVGDFLNAWRTYLKSASLVRYGSIADASRKLDSLSGNRSPLLALLALASQNTAVDDPDVSSAFQAVQAVVPPASVERFIAPSNQNYMGALLALQSSLEQAASQPGEITDAASAPVLAAAASANVAARQVAQSFRPDPAGRIDLTVKKLLEDPITQVESLMQGIGPGQLNAKAKALCAEVSPLLAKYPFNRNAPTEATVAEVNAVFRKPDGAFWTFYKANLQKLVSRQGGEYVAAPGAGLHVRAAFIAFMNKMADVSNALYSGGSDDPQFAYVLTPEPAEGIQQLGLALDGQTLSYSGGAATPKQFTWKGSTSHQATASVRFGSSPDLVWSSSQGPWAIFHLFDKADQTQSLTPGSTILNWTIRIGKDAVALPNGKPLTVRLILSTASLPPFLNKAFQRPVCSSLAVE